MALFNQENKHKWEFENIGGSSRVKISTGEDIANLKDLDPKMWTVLSCPVKGLEIDEKSLAYIDSDSDGKIRINDVVATAQWMSSAVSSHDALLDGADSFDIEDFNKESEIGRKLYCSAKEILSNLGKEGSILSVSDTQNSEAIFAKTRFNGDGIIIPASADTQQEKEAIEAIISTVGSLKDRSGEQGVNEELVNNFYKAADEYYKWYNSAPTPPFGEDTDSAYASYMKLDAKVRDYFMRSSLASFSPESTATLDVQSSRIELISADNLCTKVEQIGDYPLARVNGSNRLDLSASVNPIWEKDFRTLVSIIFPQTTKSITIEDWSEAGSKFKEYITWKESKAGAVVEPLGIDRICSIVTNSCKDALMALIKRDLMLAQEAADIEQVNKFLHLYRDLGRVLRNFVTFQDFYDKNRKHKAIFQSGTLLIDKRECKFCMRVSNMANHKTMAPASGMYLVYCDCTTKSHTGAIQIVAAVTVGGIGDIFVGKNALYYDNDGVEWDAVVTSIVDNPISIAQAFWSPYRRIASAIENLIGKNAAEKDAKLMDEVNTKLAQAPKTLPTEKPEGEKKDAVPFDIGKFAGIIAALGMAVGMIGTAVTGLVKGFVNLTWWQLICTFAGIMLVISGPSMVMAWLKLRRRNIAPLLNANGWAINASSKINILFGETLTSIATYPKLKLKDPYAKKGLPLWKKLLISLGLLIVVGGGIFCLFYFYICA